MITSLASMIERMFCTASARSIFATMCACAARGAQQRACLFDVLRVARERDGHEIELERAAASMSRRSLSVSAGADKPPPCLLRPL